MSSEWTKELDARIQETERVAKAHLLTVTIYQATSVFPRDELFGLTSQIRRASVSIPANIAEGCGRERNAELAHFLQIASGSARELEYHLLLSHDLQFLSNQSYEHLDKLVGEVRKMLITLIKKLRK